MTYFKDQFYLTEVELGERVAVAIDAYDACGWTALDDLSYEEWIRNTP